MCVRGGVVMRGAHGASAQVPKQRGQWARTCILLAKVWDPCWVSVGKVRKTRGRHKCL